MRKRFSYRMIAALASVVLMMSALSGCGGQKRAEDTAEPAVSAETGGSEAGSAEAGGSETGGSGVGAAETGGSESGGPIEAERQVGERFERAFEFAGAEEMIKYEHIGNDTIGIEMDYAYELFNRSSEEGREYFALVYDYAEEPEYYFEVVYREEDIDSVSESISEALSGECRILKDEVVLERAGSCVRIDASEDLSGRSPEHLQEVWIIPAGYGCIVAKGYNGLDSTDYFSKMYRDMANSIVVK